MTNFCTFYYELLCLLFRAFLPYYHELLCHLNDRFAVAVGVGLWLRLALGLRLGLGLRLVRNRCRRRAANALCSLKVRYTHLSNWNILSGGTQGSLQALTEYAFLRLRLRFGLRFSLVFGLGTFLGLISQAPCRE